MLQALAVEAGGTAAQPMEQAGITEDVIQKLQERATVLTQERKRRGRSVPEDLLPQDSIRAFQTLASHPVILHFIIVLCSLNCLIHCCNFRLYSRVSIPPVYPEYLHLIYTVQILARS